MLRARVVLLAILAAALGVGSEACAEVASAAIPRFHGRLRLARGAGRLDRQSGAARFTVRHWRMVLADGSNGIFPGEEPVVIAFGTDQFRLEPGALSAGRRGRFRFRAPKVPDARGILALDLRRLAATVYDVSFTVADVQLFPLTENAPVCMPAAVIVGDDDGFSGVDFDRPGFPERLTSRVVVRRRPCDATAWPWT